MKSLSTVLALVALSSACGPKLPTAPPQCDATGAGCLSDEVCQDSVCVPRPKCNVDADCPTSAFSCVLPAQVCTLREGFGQECANPDAPCGQGKFCALGQCLATATANVCSRETDCRPGQKCSGSPSFLCIPDCDCNLATNGFPECGCDTEEQCDAVSGRCALPCASPPACTTDGECGGTEKCNGSCRCVACITNADCGAGLVCDARAGVCKSVDACFSDTDCTPPLICGASGLCEVAPPACASDFDCTLGQQCDVGSGNCIFPQGECVGDRFEDSDTPAHAHVVDVAFGANDPIIDLELCPNDDDVFSVDLQAGDTLVVQLSDTFPEARATMWLLDSSGETSLAFAETPPRGSGQLTYTAQTGETVYIRLSALVAATPYTIEFERENGTPCAVDAFDLTQSNDTVLTATSGVEGVDVNATICPGDKDIFRYDVAAGEALRAALSFDSATDLDIAFLDDAGNLIAQSAGTSDPEVLQHRFVTAATVYVRVQGFGNDIGSYDLNVTRLPPFTCQPDSAEPADNDVTTAPALGVGEELPPAPRTMCIGDVDLIPVALEDFERLVVSAVYDDSDVELSIEILDAAGTTVRKSSPPGTGGAGVSYDAQGNETVLVRITGISGATGAYTLSITRENKLDCTPDPSEPNNSVAAAKPVPVPGTLLSLCANDQDFFAIHGTAGKKLVADASFRQADADIDLVLIGLDGSQVLAAADGTGDGEHLEVVLPLDGTYTLRVFSLQGTAEARYTLSVTEVTP